MSTRKDSAGDPEDITMILQTRNQVYIDIVLAALENENIPALLKSITGYNNRGMLPFNQGFFDYRLYVAKIDETKARDIVETIVPAEEIV